MAYKQTKTKKELAECPSCDSHIPVGRPAKMGQIVVCPVCKEQLQVVWLNPVELDWAITDDYDDYEDEDYDDEDY